MLELQFDFHLPSRPILLAVTAPLSPLTADEFPLLLSHPVSDMPSANITISFSIILGSNWYVFLNKVISFSYELIEQNGKLRYAGGLYYFY
jgi:hypothetical protein